MKNRPGEELARHLVWELVASLELWETAIDRSDSPDFARGHFSVSRSLSWADQGAAVVEAAGPTLAAVEYLDTFQGGNLAADEQSVHFGMTFRHPERTLTGDEVDQVVKAIVAACGSHLGAKLRV